MACNVLVVDDSAVMRAMTIRTLRLGGVLLGGVPLGGVYEAGNGEQGLRALAGHRVDLLLPPSACPSTFVREESRAGARS